VIHKEPHRFQIASDCGNEKWSDQAIALVGIGTAIQSSGYAREIVFLSGVVNSSRI
jgi:hypothetical protein